MVSPLDQMPHMPSRMDVGSGINTQKMAKDLVQAERAPREQRMGRREEELQEKLSALGKLQKSMDKLQGAVEGLGKADAYSGVKASSSNPDAVSVSASDEARPGQYEVQVEQLARSQRIATASGAIEDASDPMGPGKLTLVDGEGHEQTVTIGREENTLLGVRDAINSQAEGVRAAIVDDGEGPRLTIATERTGEDRAIESIRAQPAEIDPEPKQRLVSAPYEKPDEVLGTGRLTFVDAEWGEETVTVGEDQNTLSGIRDAINQQAEGVRASLREEGEGTRLVLRPQEAGAEHAIRQVRAEQREASDLAALTWVSSDLGDLRQLQFNAPGAEGREGRALEQTQAAAERPIPEEVQQGRQALRQLQFNTGGEQGGSAGAFEQIQAASDAVVTVNGMRVTRSGNQIEDALQGVTLQAQSEGRSRVSIEEKTGLAEENVQGLVDAYNKVQSQLNQLTAYNPEDDQAGPLQGDHTVRNISRQLSRALTDPVEALRDQPVQSLSEIGVQTNRDGTLELDTERLQEVASRHGEAVTRLMADSENGVVARMERALENTIGEDGAIQRRTDGLESRLEGISEERKELDERMERREEQLRSKFTDMDSRVMELNQTSDMLKKRLASVGGGGNGG